MHVCFPLILLSQVCTLFTSSVFWAPKESSFTIYKNNHFFPQVKKKETNKQKKPFFSKELVLRDQLEPKGPEAYRLL